MNAALVLGATSLALFAAVPVPAAQAATPAYCNIDTLLESPQGLALTPGSSTFTSSGAAACVGEPAGIRATGPGTYTSTGSFEGGCAGLSGTFAYRITLPTADGPRSFTDSGDFGTGYFTSQRGAGAFEFIEFNGDCVNKPLTTMRVIGQFFLYR